MQYILSVTVDLCDAWAGLNVKDNETFIEQSAKLMETQGLKVIEAKVLNKLYTQAIFEAEFAGELAKLYRWQIQEFKMSWYIYSPDGTFDGRYFSCFENDNFHEPYVQVSSYESKNNWIECMLDSDAGGWVVLYTKAQWKKFERADRLYSECYKQGEFAYDLIMR